MDFYRPGLEASIWWKTTSCLLVYSGVWVFCNNQLVIWRFETLVVVFGGCMPPPARYAGTIHPPQVSWWEWCCKETGVADNPVRTEWLNGKGSFGHTLPRNCDQSAGFWLQKERSKWPISWLAQSTWPLDSGCYPKVRLTVTLCISLKLALRGC